MANANFTVINNLQIDQGDNSDATLLIDLLKLKLESLGAMLNVAKAGGLSFVDSISQDAYMHACHDLSRECIKIVDDLDVA